MNRDRLLADAKTAALRLAGEYRPPQPALIARPGPSARPPLLEAAAKLDPEVGEILATLLTGSTTTPLSEAAVYDLEREAFLSLVRRPAAQARIEQMLGARSR